MKSIYKLLIWSKKYWHFLIITGLCLIGITAMNLLSPWIIRDLIALMTAGLNQDSLKTVYTMALILTASYIFRGLFRFGYQYFSHVCAWNVVENMRVRIFDHFQKLSLSYYHDKQTGQLMSRTVNDTAVLELLTAHAIPDIITNVLIVAGVAVLLFSINPVLALLALIPIPFILIFSVLFTKKVRPIFTSAHQALAELNAELQDSFSGIKEIQAFNRQETAKINVKAKSRKYTKHILAALKRSAVFHPSMEFVTSMGTAIVVAVGGSLAVGGTLTTADIVGFILYLNLFYTPISALARVSEEFSQALAGIERIFEILNTMPDIADGANARDAANVQGNISFEHVWFNYNNDADVLKDINLDIKAGQMVALVGPTGVGKTTITSLIPRFYDPREGTVKIDGVDLRDITLKSLRGHISMVLQDVFLFNGTIAENIAYGNAEATIEDIIEASKSAYIHEYIISLPEGYDTTVGERGVRLSGGQKQRISIARAILRDTPILILDEATASVDAETEAEIQSAINALAGSRTVIVIAHRLSTVRRADNIIVLEDGRIVQRGTHNELIAEENGTYSRLCLAQLAD